MQVLKLKRDFLKKVYYYKTDYLIDIPSCDLSKAIGKNNIKIIGIIDEGFKELIIEKL